MHISEVDLVPLQYSRNETGEYLVRTVLLSFDSSTRAANGSTASFRRAAVIDVASPLYPGGGREFVTRVSDSGALVRTTVDGLIQDIVSDFAIWARRTDVSSPLLAVLSENRCLVKLRASMCVFLI